MYRIYADFMKSDSAGRLILTCLGTYRDLTDQGIELRHGMHLAFYNDDVDDSDNVDNLIVEGIVEYDDKNGRWVAEIDWDAIKNISALKPEERKKFGI